MSIPIVPSPGASIVGHTVTDVTAVDTTTETTLATLAVPIDVAAGDVLRFQASGDLLNNTGSNVTYAVKLKLGSTTILDTTARSVGTNSGRRYWNADASILLGATNAQRVLGALISYGTPGSNKWQDLSFSAGGGYNAATEDLTSTKNLVLTITMGTASSSADMILHAAALTHVRRSAY